MIPIRESAGAVSFAIRVHPRAKKNAVSGTVGDALKLSLTAAPVEGEANAACTAFLAGLLKVPQSSVTILAGQGSRSKVVRVAGLDARQAQERLGAAMP